MSFLTNNNEIKSEAKEIMKMLFLSLAIILSAYSISTIILHFKNKEKITSKKICSIMMGEEKKPISHLSRSYEWLGE